MKIQSISANVYGPRLNKNSKIYSTAPVDKPMPVPVSGFWISFSGAEKNPNQILSFTPESNYLGGIYKAGGVGCVADEAPDAMKQSGKDIRSVLPYYSYNDDQGRIYVLQNGKKGDKLDDYKLVEQSYKLGDGESFALVTDVNDGTVKKSFKLEDLGLSGSVKRMKPQEMDMEDVSYRMFKVAEEFDAKKGFVPPRADAHYIVHTPYQAKGKFAYGVYDFHKVSEGTGAYGGSGIGSGSKQINYSKIKLKGLNAGDLYFTDFNRAVLDSAEKLAQKEGFNPRNYWIHDRFGYPMIPEIIQRTNNGEEFFKGMRIAGTFHNVGRAYQGAYVNPLEFFRIIATEDDFNKLKAREDFGIIKQMDEAIIRGKGLSGKNVENLDAVFRSAYGDYVDDFGSYNMTKIAVHHTDIDPEHFVVGTVSQNFGKEMISMDTEEIAEGMTQSLAKIKDKTHNITNGSRPANMKTDLPGGFFGKGNLHDIFNDKSNVGHYTPYSINDDVSVRFNAKKANKTNLLNIIHDATVEANKKDGNKDAIADLFFSHDDMKNKLRGDEKDLKLTLGGLSKYEEGDVLLIGWGRPDPQKGYPVSLRAFKEFLMDESVPLEQRLHTKVILGAGAGDVAFHKGNPEWDLIQKEIKEIAELQGGIFKNNALYVNGFFPSRLANCSDASILTSRFEPCGITPLESYAAGCPVISVNTGGAPDFVKEGKTGFLTADPFKLSPEKLGVDLSKVRTEEYATKLDEARISYSAKQVAEKIKAYVTGYTEDSQKAFIENTMNEKIGWGENAAYNGGKSALERYDSETFVSGQTLSKNNYNHKPSDFGKKIERFISGVGGDINDPANVSKWTKGRIALVTAAVVAAGAGVYYFVQKNKKSQTPAVTQQYVNNVNNSSASRYQQQLKVNA